MCTPRARARRILRLALGGRKQLSLSKLWLLLAALSRAPTGALRESALFDGRLRRTLYLQAVRAKSSERVLYRRAAVNMIMSHYVVMTLALSFLSGVGSCSMSAALFVAE